MCFVAEKEELQLLRPLQLCRERERNCSYYDRSSCVERDTAATTTAVQKERGRERNCSYYDRFRESEREKLQLETPSTAELRLRFSQKASETIPSFIKFLIPGAKNQSILMEY